MLSLILAVKSIDFLGDKPNLNIGGSSSVKTFLGALLSVGCIASIAYGGLLSISSFLDDTSPNIRQELAQLPKHPVVNVFDNRMMPLFGVFSELQARQLPPSEVFRYITVNAYVKNIFADVATGIPQYKITPLPAVACSSLTPEEDEAYDYILADPVMVQVKQAYGVCLRLPDRSLMVGGKITDQNFTYLTFDLLPCSLSSNCASPLELANSFINFVHPNTNFNTSNFRRPTQRYPETMNFIRFSVNNYAHSDLQFQRNSVYDNRAFSSNATLKEEYIQFLAEKKYARARDGTQMTCTPASVLARTCVPYLRIEIQSSANQLVTIRTYLGVVETLSNIGGMIELVVLAFTLVYRPFSLKTTKKFLEDHIFNLSKDYKDFYRYTQGKGGSSSKIGTMTMREGGRSCLCLRKRSPEQAYLKEAKEAADQTVVNNLDIISVIKELSSIKFLMEHFLNKKQRRLIPFLSLNDTRQEIIRKRELEKHLKANSQGALSDQKEAELTFEEAINVIEATSYDEDASTSYKNFEIYISKMIKRIRKREDMFSLGELIDPRKLFFALEESPMKRGANDPHSFSKALDFVEEKNPKEFQEYPLSNGLEMQDYQNNPTLKQKPGQIMPASEKKSSIIGQIGSKGLSKGFSKTNKIRGELKSVQARNFASNFNK